MDMELLFADLMSWRDEKPSAFKSSTFNVQRSLRELFKV